MRLVAIVTLVLCSGIASAADTKLEGAWSKKADGFTLKIAFQKGDKLQFSMTDGDNGCKLDATYTVDKDGTVKCVVTKFEKTGNFNVEKEKGYKFSFKPEIKGKTAKVSNFEGKDIDDQAKAILEGDYDKAND